MISVVRICISMHDVDAWNRSMVYVRARDKSVKVRPRIGSPNSLRSRR
jgi:hypothetical protein